MGILDALRDPQFRQDVLTNARSFGQSASNTLAGNVAAPLDLIALALRKAGIPVPEPVGGSQWMENKGLTREVPQGAPRLAGEAFGLIAPLAGAPQSAAAIARGLRQMEENAFNPAMLNKQAGALKYPTSSINDSSEIERMNDLKTLAQIVGQNTIAGGINPEVRAMNLLKSGLLKVTPSQEKFLHRMLYPDGTIRPRMAPGFVEDLAP